MSGFSADWLRLREPADHRARNRDLLMKVGRQFADRAELRIVDLGCGLASNLRALAPHLPAVQHWHLVDYDDGLLAAARDVLCSWADQAVTAPGGDVLHKDGRRIEAEYARVDLASVPDRAIPADAGLVTAAALFDLVSESWIEQFGAVVSELQVPLYTVLTYNGEQTWTPPHPADAAMLAAFHVHQSRDKGFGAAAGPSATGALSEAFVRAGYEVATGTSPWGLGDSDAPLIAELARGTAQAVEETSLVPAADVRSWLAAREAGASCVIGHTDLFAMPRK